MNYADSRCKVTDIGGTYQVVGKDIFSGRTVEVKIPAPALFAYRQGAYIQDAMPMLSAQEREFLLSGIYDPI
jgi:hypothetical protein